MTDTTSGSIAHTALTSPVLTTIARQQAIENALSAALHLVRTTDTAEGYSKATGRAIRAASMLKQACTEATNGGRA